MSRTSLCLIATLFVESGCVQYAPLSISARYVHIVLIKTKTSPAERGVQDILQEVDRLILPIPTVKGFWVGKPVPRTSTEEYIVDASYDVGMVFVFDSQRELEEFRGHPGFLEFQQRFRDKIEARVLDLSPYAGPLRPAEPSGQPQPPGQPPS